jgi:hypothetical protein
VSGIAALLRKKCLNNERGIHKHRAEIARTMLPPHEILSPDSMLLPITPVEKYNDEVREMWAQPHPQEVEGLSLRHGLQSPDTDKLDRPSGRLEIF